jgi:4-hydroxy-tetrahydrodipicolinate synthase
MRLATPAIMPALLTPFDDTGAVDREALRAHVTWLIDRGADGMMPCGTTGETALLSDDEVIAVVETVVAAADGRVPVIAHVGRPGTQPTIALGRRALDAGAAAVSAVVPYYHVLEPEQVLGHYRAIMGALGAERVLAYSIPSHSNNGLGAADLATLAREGLAGFKDSTMSGADHDAYVEALRGAGRDDFGLLVGLGALLLQSLRAGSAGAVLGIANLRPELCRRVRDAFLDGRDEEAEALQAQLAGEERRLMAFPELKRATAERLRAEAGVAYGPLMRAPLGTAGSAVAQRAWAAPAYRWSGQSTVTGVNVRSQSE